MNKSKVIRVLILSAGISSVALPAAADQDLLAYFSPQFNGVDVSGTQAQNGDLLRHDIDDLGHCSFVAKRGVRWSRSFSDGSRLEVDCQPGPRSLLPGYHLWYRNASGSRIEIGKCIFDHGWNHGWYYTDGNSDVPLRVEWVSVDGGSNDGGSRRIDQEHYTGPEEPYVDVVRWTFDVRARRLECTSEKYQYASAQDRLPAHPVDSLAPYLGERMDNLSRSFLKLWGN
ncbi:MAG TPA: hypothetical protein VMB25_05015 [Bryobacteraceae bacterium]|nr:hypothetical protein [Bryobacteraceae bacterium]